ncbi:MAG: HAD family phosphatase [Candidatus Saccharibacteria bacterium]|nr:HAD family phosphatase [Candidatus Saccharibacteria bacterium]
MAAPGIKAIIFDCFGVLYLGAHRALEERWPQYSEELNNLSYQLDYGFIEKDEFLQKSGEVVGQSAEKINDILESEHNLNSPLITYIEQQLKPHYKIGIISNIGRGWMQNMFDEYLLDNVFDSVIQSGDEGVTKPHPQIYELCAERLGLEPEQCIFIDDLPENIAGADAAGMQGLVYGNLYDLKKELPELLK